MKKLIFSLIFAPAILLASATLTGCDDTGNGKENGGKEKLKPFAFHGVEMSWGAPSNYVVNLSTHTTTLIEGEEKTLENGDIEMMFEGDIDYTGVKEGTTDQYYYYFSPEDQLIKAVAFMHLGYFEDMFDRAEMNGQYDAVAEIFTQESTNTVIRVIKGKDPRSGNEGTLAIFEPIKSPVGIALNFEEPIQEWGIIPGVLKERINEAGGNGNNLTPAGGTYFSYPGGGSADSFGYNFFNGVRLYGAVAIYNVLYTTEILKHLDSIYEYQGVTSATNGTDVHLFFNETKMANIRVYVDALGEPPLLMVEFRQVEYTK